ncbi:MAG: leucyl/phenylalanyl-tRNA--protein transferase [Saprospiraceae bacterium]|nr:leucyl/phenylalanyl-tRNA--protein transferase [Saprospiraceae bacterium]
MSVFWLDPHDFSFPPVELAEESGLLAVSTDLRPERLLSAYRSGIFPWFEDQGHFFWFCPDPRLVLFPAELKVQKSMRPIFNQNRFAYTMNRRFRQVMEACAETPRGGQEGTWITPAFIDAYTRLHAMGVAYSMEVWDGEELVGGLYGVLLGRVFFGESMFARATNASKAGFITLVRALERSGVGLIDCQQETEHLQSMGARTISRKAFLTHIKKLVPREPTQDE